MDYPCRRQKISNLLVELELSAILFSKPEQLRYLCGFTGSDGALIVSSTEMIFLTDSRYTMQAREQVVADRVEEYKVKGDSIITQLKTYAPTKIGFEAELAFGTAQDLQQRGDESWQWVALGKQLDSLRLSKEPDEVSAVSVATQANFEAFTEIRNMIQPGVSERAVALALEFALKQRGAEEKAFDFIVASGYRGAMPHGVASERIIEQGDLVTIDFGCRFRGYHSDETVTLAVGAVSDELRNIFDIVLEAHDRALAAVVPGIALIELDRIAREHIDLAGYGQYFGHGLGHGVGLEVHEAPVVSPRSRLTAEEGMIFTIEPGIYLPDVGGVRIEDMVLVTSDGSKILTKIPKTFCNVLVN